MVPGLYSMQQTKLYELDLPGQDVPRYKMPEMRRNVANYFDKHRERKGLW